MVEKQLFVTTQVQATLLAEVLIPEMCNGYWKDHRPAGHGKQWEGVDIRVTTNGQVGPYDFKVPRNYNFVNPEFIELMADRLVEVAKTVNPSITLKLVKRQLTELSQIVGGRKTDLNVTATKAYRGHNVIDDTPTVNVFESKRGLGSEKWLPLTKQVIDALEDVGTDVSLTSTNVVLSRGNNHAKMAITGADEFVLQSESGVKIVGTFDPNDGEKIVQYAQLYMLSVNNRKQNVVKSSNASVTELPNGSVVRRVPVTRVALSDKEKFAINPFNL